MHDPKHLAQEPPSFTSWRGAEPRPRRTQGGAQRQLQAWPLHRRGDPSSVAEGEDREGVDQDASRPALIACEANPSVAQSPASLSFRSASPARNPCANAVDEPLNFKKRKSLEKGPGTGQNCARPTPHPET
jgi:hypothetical protein